MESILIACKVYNEVKGKINELSDIVAEKLGEVTAEIFSRLVELGRFEPTIGELTMAVSEVTDGFAETIELATFKYKVFRKACEKLGVEDVKVEVKKDDKSGVSETTR